MKLLSLKKEKRERKHRFAFMVMAALSLMTLFTGASYAQVKNIVLVHGAFADGSGYQKLYTILTERGYKVSVVGNPNTGLDEDAAATKRVLDRQDGPCILAGHSYGGAIITVAGNHSKVAGLVYIAAFAPDKGEALGALIGKYPPDPANGIQAPVDGYLWYDQAKFHSGFCADLPKEEAAFMYASQVPVSASGFGYVFNDIAWKTKPTWYIVATDDHSIQPDLERFMGKRTGGKVTEIKSSHVVFISHAKEVADVIEAAAKGSVAK